MMKSTLFILLNIVLIVTAVTYVNFDPHKNCGGTNPNGEGIGYSWITGTCLNLDQGSYLIEIDPHDSNTAIFYFFSNPNSKCAQGEPNVTKSYAVNTCYPAQWIYDRAFYNVYNYAVMSIVEDPGYQPLEGYRYTLYQKQDTVCHADYLMYYYYTNDMKFHNTMQTFLYQCVDETPYETLCTQGLPCINSTIYFTCQNTNSNKYHYSITC
ncbi:hypothetical protein CYY_002427 [Polysphondylium violaceum]|uniref:Uncharacterized protein n=1 Tax=Polysphondylium violaceum TaxID=133409 RepID=A0A8J4Q043_9MYCE|nr:hypothetical protein CYY_002427 [Polysphondylium violaceum]